MAVSQLLTAQGHVKQGINLWAMELNRLFKVGQRPPVVLELKAKTGQVKSKIILFTDGKVALPDLVDGGQQSSLFLGGNVRGKLL